MPCSVKRKEVLWRCYQLIDYHISRQILTIKAQMPLTRRAGFSLSVKLHSSSTAPDSRIGWKKYYWWGIITESNMWIISISTNKTYEWVYLQHAFQTALLYKSESCSTNWSGILKTYINVMHKCRDSTFFVLRFHITETLYRYFPEYTGKTRGAWLVQKLCFGKNKKMTIYWCNKKINIKPLDNNLIPPCIDFKWKKQIVLRQGYTTPRKRFVRTGRLTIRILSDTLSDHAEHR